MTPEQETELANAIVECGAGYRDTGFYYIDPETDGLCAELFILDGRVVLAMMEKQQRRISRLVLRQSENITSPSPSPSTLPV
jgi:hypothetical protein